MASIGAELSLAQRFEPLVFISGVLNPWVIGFAGVIVICAASNYSPGGPPGAPAALCGDGEPKSSHGTRSGGTKGSWHAGMSNKADKAGVGAGCKLGPRKVLVLPEV